MRFSISRLTKHHIGDDYLGTLNDYEYMRFSQHKNKPASTESQLQYLNSFDFISDFLLAITDRESGEMVATATLRLLRDDALVNIGFLVLKKFGGVGLGKEVLRELSTWVFDLFPLRNQQIGTRHENIGMQRIALAAGFRVDDGIQNIEFIYFLRRMHELPQILEVRNFGFHIVCNDAGGAFQISALANQLFPEATATLGGPAIGIFARNSPSISILDVTSNLIANKKIIFGSGFYGGLESKFLESDLLSGNYKVVLLDHWVNYRERFNSQNLSLPDAFLVTNTRAAELASDIFPHTLVKQIPDFLLAEQKRRYLSQESYVDSVLLILEPNALIGEGLNFSIKNIEKYLSIVVNYCLAYGLTRIVLRKHPSQILDFVPFVTGAIADVKVDYSSNVEIVEDFLSARAVFGFHSSALYTSAMLGIETYSFFAGVQNHWTNHFPAILKIG